VAANNVREQPKSCAKSVFVGRASASRSQQDEDFGCSIAGEEQNMSDRLGGKVALIAGSASGMGRAGAILMAEQGANVVFADLNVEQAQIEADRLQHAA
jgi:hypothetical protein